MMAATGHPYSTCSTTKGRRRAFTGPPSLRFLIPRRKEFERLTSLAARFLNAPIALISLVDQDRQWFKSCYGLETRQTDRESAFRAYSILGDQVMVVPDGTRDTRFADNRLVTGPPGVRSYAGAPLRVSCDKSGTVCIIDLKLREGLLPAEVTVLSDLAAVASSLLEEHYVQRQKRQAKRALQKIQADYRAIVANIREVVFQTDAQGLWTFLNPAWAETAGFSIKEAIGRQCSFQARITCRCNGAWRPQRQNLAEQEDPGAGLAPCSGGDASFGLVERACRVARHRFDALLPGLRRSIRP